MQIHELTKKRTQVNEDWRDTLSSVKTAVTSPIKSIRGAMDQSGSGLTLTQKVAGVKTDDAIKKTARQARRDFEVKAAQWAKTMGGTFVANKGMPASATTTPAQPVATAEPAAAAKAVDAKTMQNVYQTLQRVDDKQLDAIIKILTTKAGGAVTESQLSEVDWGAVGSKLKGAASATGSALKGAGKYLSKAAGATGRALAAAPGAIARGAGTTVGKIQNMPAQYRGAQQSAVGAKLTPQELQLTLTKIDQEQAKELLQYATQIQQMRQSGLKEGVNPELQDRFEEFLMQYVQKNLLAGKYFSRMANASEIQSLVREIADPANGNASMQENLWQQLVRACFVGEHTPAAGPGGEEPAADVGSTTPRRRAPAGSESPEAMVDSVKGAVGDLSAAGNKLRSNFTSGDNEVKSTGQPAVDAMLLSMGFRIR